MRVLLFTAPNCQACGPHAKSLLELAERLKFSVMIYNIDHPAHFHMTLKAMRTYGVKKTPSIVLLNYDQSVLGVYQGIANTLTKLEEKINATREST